MLDHMGFGVTDFRRSKVFYEKALAPLGIGIVKEVPEREAIASVPPASPSSGSPGPRG